MATIGPTGVGIPDIGDPDASASQLVIDNIEDYQSHQHRGPAFNEPPKIGGSSWLGDATMNNNSHGITNLIYTSFTDPVAVVPPNRSIYYDDGVGFVFKTEGGTEATLVTSAGSIPTTNGEGFIGLGPPARATYTAGVSRYAFYDDFDTLNLGDLLASQVKATNNAADCFAQLTSDGTSGVLELTEDSADFSFFLKLPSGWNAAASSDQEINVQPPTVIEDIAGGSGIISAAVEAASIGQGSWTPTITAGSKNYVHQVGTWFRIGSMVVVEFDVQYNTGAGIASVTIGGLPFARAATWRGITAPTDAGPCGQIFNTTALATYHGRMSGSTILVLDATGASPAGGVAGHFSGQAIYFTGP